MIAIKRIRFLTLVFLCLVFAVCVSAESTVQEAYQEIIKDYQAAQSASSSEKALESLRELLNYYEAVPGRAEALEAYEGGTAWVYYTYAKGMIAFNDKDYVTAAKEFKRLQGIQLNSGSTNVPDLPDTTYYYQFSMAQRLWDIDEYESAFEALEAARQAPGSSIKACDDAQTLFLKALRQKAESCCEQGNHAMAQEYYKLYAQIDSIEGKELLKNCEQHSQEAPLRIISAIATSSDTIVLSWTGSNGPYCVSWSADLTGEASPKSQIVQGNSVEVVDSFLPGTVYRISVALNGTNGAPAAVNVTTPSASLYQSMQGTDIKITESILRNYQRANYLRRCETNLKENDPYSVLVYYILQLTSEPSVSSIEWARIAGSPEDGRNGYALFLKTNQTAEAVNALKPEQYTVLLHIDQYGTVSSTGYFGDRKSALYSNVIAFALDDVLDEAVNLYAPENRTGFTLEFLINGQLIGGVTGVFVTE